MHALLFKWLTIAFAAVLASSTVTMVAAFFGWLDNEDVRDLLFLQALMIPVSVVAAILGFIVLARRCHQREVFRTFWARLPGWLVLIVTIALSLVLIAELAFILLQRLTGNTRPWIEHMPAASAFFSSIALAACYVVLHLGEGAPGTDPLQQPVDRQP